MKMASLKYEDELNIFKKQPEPNNEDNLIQKAR